MASLALFNHNGEANVSSVDIAMELDISPGNLYYHFKGKEVIVAALFDLHKSRLEQVLKAGRGHTFSLEEFFYFLHLVFEQGWLFRFVYQNPTDLISKYPSVAKPFKRQITGLESDIGSILLDLNTSGQLAMSQPQLRQLEQLIGLVFTQSPNYYSLKGTDLDDEDALYQGLSTILFAVLPFARVTEPDLTHLQQAIANHTLAGDIQVDDT